MCIGVFKWAESHQAVDYTNWLQGEPSDGGMDGHEDCVQTYTRDSGESFGWNDATCDDSESGYNNSGYFALCMRSYN